MFSVNSLFKRAKERNKTIVFPEAGFSPRVEKAVEDILKKKICNVILLGDPDKFAKNKKLAGANIINPENSDLTEELANKLYEARKEKGMTIEQATDLVKKNAMYFASMLVDCGYADGYLGGAETSTTETLRPALQIIKGARGTKTISSCFMFVGTNKLGFGENGVIFTADCGLNINPTAEELSEIVLTTAKTAKELAGITPRVAMLSFSSFGSGGDKDENIIKSRQAMELVKQKDPTLEIDGEMQVDCALVPSVAKLKAPNSKVAGKANILVFPELTSGNIGYKLIERFGGVQALGPITQGFRKPANDLSRGCKAEDIVVMAAITVLQAD